MLSGAGESISIEHHKQIIDNLKLISLEFQNIQFVVKLHRKDKLGYYREGSKKHKLIIVDSSQNLPQTIFKWLNGCSAVLTGGSTAGVEALLMGIPVISMDFNNELTNLEFIKNKISIHCESYEDLKNALNAVISKDKKIDKIMHKSKSFIKDSYYNAGIGQSSNRIVNVLTKVINKN